MKISLDWVNTYLDTPCGREEAQRVLTSLGFPVEDCKEVALPGPEGGVAVMLDVEVTSNRGDCLSHVGLARELAAGLGKKMVERQGDPHPRPLPSALSEAPPAAVRVHNEEPQLCPLYTARVITDVRVGPSPHWLVRYLLTVGMRSVNNVVDVTNFVLMELGQPLHAFDLAKLEGREIRVRRATKNEAFVAIDGSKHTLTDRMLVIADAQRAVAVAGVMGGVDSEVGQTTTDIVLESAMFDPLSVRTTSRASKLSSDSSYRFERGVDPLGVERASRRATELIVELAGGRLAEGVIRAGCGDPTRHAPRQVVMRTDRCNALLGTSLSISQQADDLARLGLEPKVNDGAITCVIPSYRLDLHREVDLIEEVARLHGLDEIGVREKIEIIAQPPQPALAAERIMRQVLIARGDHETVTPSFVDPVVVGPLMPAGESPVMIEDDRRKAEPMLRPTLLASLLICRKANQDRGNHDVQLFEAAAAWTKHRDKIIERNLIAIVRDATEADHALRELRSTVEELVERLGGGEAMAKLTVMPTEADGFAVAAEVAIGETPLGRFGLVDAELQSQFGLQTAVVAAELHLPALIALYPPQRTVAVLPRFPGIERDLSLIVDEAITWRDIEQVVRGHEPAMLESLEFITVYRGKPIPPGRKSVSLRMRFRDPGGTLRHEEVDPQVAEVVKSLGKEVGAELRQ